jgi:hypothetical protein
MIMKALVGALTVSILLLAPVSGWTAVISCFDDGYLGANVIWQVNKVTPSPLPTFEQTGTSIGNTFLGTASTSGFRNDTAALTVNNLGAHNQIVLSFDLLLHGTWDGNKGSDWDTSGAGPDRWLLTSGASTLIDTTFSHVPWDYNNSGSHVTHFYQSYPGSYSTTPIPSNIRGEGRISGSENWVSPGSTIWESSGYHIVYTLNHTSDNVSFLFQGNLGGLSDEYWSLNNVTINPVPEPYEYGLIATACLLAYGIYDRRLFIQQSLTLLRVCRCSIGPSRNSKDRV